MCSLRSSWEIAPGASWPSLNRRSRSLMHERVALLLDVALAGADRAQPVGRRLGRIVGGRRDDADRRPRDQLGELRLDAVDRVANDAPQLFGDLVVVAVVAGDREILDIGRLAPTCAAERVEPKLVRGAQVVRGGHDGLLVRDLLVEVGVEVRLAQLQVRHRHRGADVAVADEVDLGFDLARVPDQREGGHHEGDRQHDEAKQDAGRERA